MSQVTVAVRRAVALSLVGAAHVALLAPVGVQAQESRTGGLEEVIVTAERREMALQDTPISILAITGETLEAKGVDDLWDLQDLSPNLSIKAGRTGGNNAPVFSIRGIGGGGGASGERGVALYIDGIYVPRTSGSVFRVFDIDRAEVLRGPQGTLFGRNSEGGAIRIFTKQPTNTFDAYVRGTYGNFDRKDLAGMVNIPVSDKLAVRAQAAYLSQDGYITRGTQELGSNTTKLGRVQIAYEFSDSVKLTLGGLYTDSRSDGSPQDIVSFDLRPNLNYQGNYADWLRDALVLAGQPPLQVLDDPRIVLDNRTMPDFCFLDDFNPDWDDACALKDDNKYWQADANLKWDINENLMFTSITGISRLDHDALSDNVLLGFNAAQDYVASKALYQEFQLNAKLFGGKVDAVTGLNYFTEESESNGYALQRRGTSVYSATGGTANGNVGEAFVRVTQAPFNDAEAESWGWFNSLTWHMTDKLNVTGGARLAWDRKEIQSRREVGNPVDFVPVPGTTSTTVNQAHSWRAFDWRGTVDYHFTPEIMGYATASKAYKAGAYPAFTFISCTAAPGQPLVAGSATCPTGAQQSQLYAPIPPEKVVNLEAGFRATFFDNRLRVNPTGYYMAWTDRQTTVRLPCTIGPDCTTGSNVFLRSTGAIDLYGLELDMQFALTDKLTLDGALGTTKYIIHDVVANGGPNLFPPQASPTANIGATYNLRNTSVGSFAFNSNFAYTAKQQTYPESTDPALLSDGSYELAGYTVLNSRLQWTSTDGRNLVTLFVNNLLDREYATFGTKFGGGFWDGFNSQTGIVAGLGSAAPGVGAPLRNMVSVTRARPREFGITLQHNFN